MDDRTEVEAHIGARWGEVSVLLEVVEGEALRAPLPGEVAPLASEGRHALVYLNPRGGLEGWALPDEKVGVRMDAEHDRWGSSPETLDCLGGCGTLWYAVSGGTVSPDDGCLTCGAPVSAA